MKRILILLLFLSSFVTIHANNQIELPEIARFGRGVINDIAWHPDNEIIAVASGTGVWLYDTDFNTLGQLSTHNTLSVAWSGDGDYLANVDTQNCRVWQNILSDTEIVFETDNCYHDTITWYENTFVFQMDYFTIRTIDLTNNNQEITMPFDSILRGLYTSPDGTQILGITSLRLVLWDSETGDLLYSLEIENEEFAESYTFITEATIWDDDTLFVLCSEGIYEETTFYTCEWDTENNELVKHEELFTSHFVYPQQTTFTSLQEFIYIRPSREPYKNQFLWNSPSIDRDTHLNLFYGADAVTYALNSSQNKLVIGTRDGQLLLYDMLEQGLVKESQAHGFSISDVAWHPDDGRLAVTGYGFDYEAQIWQLDDDNSVHQLNSIPLNFTETVNWSNDGSELFFEAIAYGDTSMVYESFTLDADTYNRLDANSCQCIPGRNSDISTSPDGTQQLIYDRTSNSLILDDRIIIELDDDESIYGMKWSPDGLWFSVFKRDHDNRRNVVIRDTVSWEIVFEQPINLEDALRGSYWSPDSQHFAYIVIRGERQSGSIGIVSMENPDLFEMIHFDRYVRDILWSPDSRYLMIDGSQLDFYDISSQTIVATINANSEVYDWRVDGEYLAGGNYDGTVQIWDMQELMNRTD